MFITLAMNDSVIIFVVYLQSLVTSICIFIDEEEDNFYIYHLKE